MIGIFFLVKEDIYICTFMGCGKQIFCFNKGKSLQSIVIAENQIVFVNKRFNLLKRLQSFLNIIKIAAFFNII